MGEEMKGVEKIPTGVSGLDETLEGGIPKGRINVVTGGTGTGKTVLLNEFIYQGITQFGEPGLIVTFEERPDEIKKNMRSFGWDYEKLVSEGKLGFIDAINEVSTTDESSLNYGISSLLQKVKKRMGEINAKRVAVDGLDSLFSNVINKKGLRHSLSQAFEEMRDAGVTVLVASERPDEGGPSRSTYQMSEFVSDAVISLGWKFGGNTIRRALYVKKIRGAGYRLGKVEFEITGEGMRVFPKITVEKKYEETNFEEKKSFGVEGIDKLISGGVPKGHTLMVSGNTGAGKTILGFHFLMDGLQKGENCVLVNLEEPIEQVKKTSKVFGWDLEKYEREGKLKFIHTSLIDVPTDKLIHEITEEVKEMGAQRGVIDSISSLESAALDKNDVREFLLQLNDVFKSRGVTCLLNYLSTEIFSGETNILFPKLVTNELRLSSLTDGIVLLRFFERDFEVGKFLHVLKMRGSGHSKKTWRYDICHEGLKILNELSF